MASENIVEVVDSAFDKEVMESEVPSSGRLLGPLVRSLQGSFPRH